MTNTLEKHKSLPVQADSLRDWRRKRDILTIAVLHFSFTTVTIMRYSVELTLLQYVIGITLWVVLPLLALVSLWQMCPVGRWILITLFSLRGGIAILTDVNLVSIGTSTSVIISEPVLFHTLEAFIYVFASGWLLLSSYFRRGGDGERSDKRCQSQSSYYVKPCNR